MTQKCAGMTSRNRKGFTLAEILVAMAIFGVFITVMMGSYISLVKAQRDADDYRVMYSEARRIFDQITTSVKNNSVLYSTRNPVNAIKNFYGDQDEHYYEQPKSELTLISKDGRTVYKFQKDVNSNLQIETAGFKEDGSMDFDLCAVSNLNSEKIEIDSFQIYISPSGDPYDEDNITKKYVQFQPRITIFVNFKREGRAGTYYLPMQTTVSSRFYGPSPILNGEYNPSIGCSPLYLHPGIIDSLDLQVSPVNLVEGLDIYKNVSEYVQ